MIAQSYTPAAPLSDFVDIIWLQEHYTPPHPRERILPDGSVELIINLHDDCLPMIDRKNPTRVDYFPGSIICGAHSEYFVIDTRFQPIIMGVHFKPGGAFPFFNMPANEFQNTHVALETLWGSKKADELRTRLLEAPTSQHKFRVMESFLNACAIQPLIRHRAVSFALNNFAYARSIADVTEQIGLSSTRFIQVFREEVGLTPKLFSRVQRFQQVLKLIARGQHIEWADVALVCGYFDQAHFIHDFQAFSGLNPVSYVEQRGTHHFNHVPMNE